MDAPTVIKIPSDEGIKAEEGCSLRSQRGRAKPEDGLFEVWYANYPHKIGRGAAERAWPQALARASPEILAEGLLRYIATKPPDRRWCAPAVWLNQKRWLDEPAANDGAEENGRTKRAGAFDNLIEGFGLAGGLVRQPDNGVDRETSGPLLDGEYVTIRQARSSG